MSPQKLVLVLFSHELELNHQIREGPPMVNFYRQYSPRVHQTDPQSSQDLALEQMRNERTQDLDIWEAIQAQWFTSLGDHLHNNFNDNFNHIIGGTHPEQRFPTLPELSAGLYHDPEQDKHLHISSIQGNNDYQLYDNYVGKIQNKNLNALDSIHNYQNYDTNLQYDRSTELDKIYANLFSQDNGIYHNQKIGNAENRNHYNGGQNTQDNVCEILNPSHEKTLHLNLEHNEGPDLFQNKSNNDREFPTIYSDIVASYKPQQSDMKLNYHNSAGAHSPDTQSSSLYWPGIEERLSKKANEVIDKSWSGDLGGSSGYISSNSDIYSLENPHFTEHNPFTSSREVPDFHFKEKMNHINGGILPEPRFQSLPDLSAELYKYSEHGHKIHVSGIEGNHGHQVHDKNHKSLDSDHHFQDYYNHLDQALQNFPKNPESNYVHPINQNYDTVIKMIYI
ncbi:hypothetical protein BY996DRAFT_6617198 [Phakopsora pachyrhizi]|nr:hypothetical protein BY996DRAFT_6617198 [Phakopsora pachyrhizi]